MLLAIHGFDAYSSSQMSMYWDAVNDASWFTRAGRTGNCLSFPAGGGNFAPAAHLSIAKWLPTPSVSAKEMTFGFALRIDGLTSLFSPIPNPPATEGDILGLYVPGVQATRLYVDSFGRLSIINGFSNFPGDGVVAVASPNGVALGEWHYIEIKLSTATHNVTVKMDGAGFMTAVNIVNSLPTYLTWGKEQHFLNISDGTWPGFSIDDFYLLDDTGSVNNDYLGDSGVLLSLPVAVGDSTMWIPHGVVDNWEATSDNPSDNSKYVSSKVVNDQDLYKYGALNLPTDVTIRAIRAVAASPVVMKDASGPRIVHSLLKSLGLLSTEGNDISPTMTYRYYQDIWELDPLNNPWLQPVVEVLQAGPKLVL